MFYRYEHFMSISHMVLIVAMVQSYNLYISRTDQILHRRINNLTLLPGKFQTDHLETRFSQYWWFSED